MGFIERIKFAWHVIRYGIPAEYQPPKLNHYITEHRMSMEEVVTEYVVDSRVPNDVERERALMKLVRYIEPYVSTETYEVPRGGNSPEQRKRLTLKVAVER